MWPVVAGVFSLAAGGWFLWSLAVIVRFRAEHPRFAMTQIPLPVWPAIHAAALAFIGVAMVRRHPRAQGFCFGAGVLTVIYSAQQLSTTPMAAVPVALGALMATFAGVSKLEAA